MDAPSPDLPAEQLELPGDVAEVMSLTADESSPVFSGCTGEARAAIRRKRAAILELAACGVGVRRTAEAVGCSPQAVRAVRASAWARGELDPMKQRLGRDYLAAADLLRAAALERIDEIPAQVLLLASAQAVDKGALLTGSATARVEVGVGAPTGLHDLIDALPRVGPAPGAPNKAAAAIEADDASNAARPLLAHPATSNRTSTGEPRPSSGETGAGSGLGRALVDSESPVLPPVQATLSPGLHPQPAV